MPIDWRENPSNDNWLAIDDTGDHIGTVFQTSGQWEGLWGGVTNSTAGPRYLKSRFSTPTDAMHAFDQAWTAGPASPLWQPAANLTWQRAKKGGGYYRRTGGGLLLSVKPASSGAWYATVGGELVPGWHGWAGPAVIAAEQAAARLTGAEGALLRRAAALAASMPRSEALERVVWEALQAADAAAL